MSVERVDAFVRARRRRGTAQERVKNRRFPIYTDILLYIVSWREPLQVAPKGSGLARTAPSGFLIRQYLMRRRVSVSSAEKKLRIVVPDCVSADPEVFPASRLRSKEPRVEDERHVGEVGGLMPALRNDVALRFRLYDAPWPIRHTRWPGFGHLARSTTPKRRRRGAARKKRNTRCARTSESLSKEPDLGPNGPRVPQRGAITHTRAAFREVPPIRAGTCTLYC